jgi:ribosomal protein S28E/S33
MVKTEGVLCLIGGRHREREWLFQLEHELITVLREQAEEKHVIVEHVRIRGTEGNQLAIHRNVQGVVSVDRIIQHSFQREHRGLSRERDVKVLILTFYTKIHQKGSTSL